MDSHPLFVAHDLRVVFQTMADPDKSYQEKDAIDKQERARDNVEGPIIKRQVEFSSDSTINTVIGKPNQIVDAYDSYAHIANLLSDSSVSLMFLRALVVSAEHFSHLKVPISK
jgi:hypothetical protein